MKQTKYKYILTYPDGETEDSADHDELFDTYEDAADAAAQAVSDWRVGGRINNLMGDNDYDYDEKSKVREKIVEIKV